MALSGKPGSPGIGKLVIPSVYISFSPWPLELHWKSQERDQFKHTERSCTTLDIKYVA